MVDTGQLAFSVFLVLGGVLLAIDHPTTDWLNRWLKSTGTTQRPEDIEMDDTSELVGFLVGSICVIVGLILVAQAVA